MPTTLTINDKTFQIQRDCAPLVSAQSVSNAGTVTATDAGDHTHLIIIAGSSVDSAFESIGVTVSSLPTAADTYQTLGSYCKARLAGDDVELVATANCYLHYVLGCE